MALFHFYSTKLKEKGVLLLQSTPKRQVFLNLFLSVKFKSAGIKSVISAFLFDKFIVASAFNDFSVVKNHDNIGVLNGGKAVGNYKNGSSIHKSVHTALYNGFGSGIYRRCGFIKDHNRRVCNGCSGDGNKLALTLRKSASVALKNRVVTFRKHTDKGICVRKFRRRNTHSSSVASGLP